MSHINRIRKQLEEEVVTTRKMLSIVPDQQFEWQPHPKSMTLLRLATHVAELPGWIGMAFDTPGLDFAANPDVPVPIKNNRELMDYFERNVADAREHLDKAREEQLSDPWTLRNGATVYFTEPKEDVIRMALSQLIHHRAQLGVFLRLLDIPIPGSYGPSADENNFG